jgi:hypothetical protein
MASRFVERTRIKVPRPPERPHRSEWAVSSLEYKATLSGSSTTFHLRLPNQSLFRHATTSRRSSGRVDRIGGWVRFSSFRWCPCSPEGV